MHFKHEYATGYVRADVVEEDGSLKETLFITPSISLDPADPDFDQEKATQLEIAAVEYSKNRPIDQIVFVK